MGSGPGTDALGESLSSILSPFRSEALLAGVGALQLLPENADHYFRIERLAHVVATLKESATSAAVPSPGRWRRVLNQPPLGDEQVLSREDPFTGPFTESVPFYGGGATVLAGSATDGPTVLRLVLKTLLKGTQDGWDSAVVQDAQRLSVATLMLCNRIAYQAGLRRWQRARRRSDVGVHVPPAPLFERLKRAVTYSTSQLQRGLRGDPESLLKPLVAGSAEQIDAEDGLFVTPLVKRGSDFFVAMPSGLAAALRHAILVKIQQAGLTSEFASALAKVIENEAALVLLGCGHRALPIADDPSDGVREAFFRFDNNKVAHLVTVTDSLVGYAPTEPFGSDSAPGFFEFAESQLHSARDAIKRQFEWCQGVLHIVLVQGIGRSGVVGISQEQAQDARHLALSFADLEYMTRREHGEPLALWKFAGAAGAIRERTKIVNFGSMLDEFAMYRGANYSYEVTEEKMPSLLMVDPTYAEGLRNKVAEDYDPHAVAASDEHSVYELIRRYPGSQIPIYLPEVGGPGRLRFLVEGLAIPLWVLPESDNNSTVRERFDVCEAVAYWLWQMSEPLSSVVEAISRALPAVFVRIASKHADWTSDHAAREDWCEGELQSDGPTVRLGLGFAAAVAVPDNSGERRLMRHVVEGISRLAPTVPFDVDACINEHAPLGPKKKLLAVASGRSVELADGPLPARRLVQDADLYAVFGEAGRSVVDTLGLAEGRVDRTVEAANALVSFYFKSLQKLVAELSAEGLVEYLLRHNESLLREEALVRLRSLPSEQCFGKDSRFVRRSVEEASTTAESAIANRFLIEYVAASPPDGDKTISLDAYDRLLALAVEIIRKGQFSDAVKYRFSRAWLTVRPSGLLVMGGQDQYLRGIHQYGRLHAEQGAVEARNAFSGHWEEHGSDSKVDPALDAAVEAEFGFGITDTVDFGAAAIQFGESMEGEPKVADRTEFLGEIEDRGGAKRVSAELLLEGFSLVARDDQWEGDADVYPWLFNRDLSFVRRPFVIRQGPTSEVIWGIRSVYRSIAFFVDACMFGRLKPKSDKMIEYQTLLRAKKARRFNKRLADLFAKRPELMVRENVRRFAGVRIQREQGQDLGDVDVLVVRPDKALILSVEAKATMRARTPSELRNEIDKLLTGPDSTLQKHREREAWLHDHREDLCTWLRLPRDGRNWRVRSAIATEERLITPYVVDTDLPVVAFEDIEADGGRSLI